MSDRGVVSEGSLVGEFRSSGEFRQGVDVGPGQGSSGSNSATEKGIPTVSRVCLLISLGLHGNATF